VAGPFALQVIVRSLDIWAACWDFELDRTGNRTKLTVTGSTVTNEATSYTVNAADQLKSRATGVSTASYDYDANGNETAGPGRTFAYNQRDQQTSVTIAGVGAYSVSFLGAGQAERYDANNIKLQFNALGLGVRDNGPSDTSFFTRTETGRLLSHRFSAGRSYYLTDALGSVTGLVDASGALVRTVRYDPAGQVLSSTDPKCHRGARSRILPSLVLRAVVRCPREPDGPSSTGRARRG
jgi:YD repeat-containing protein